MTAVAAQGGGSAPRPSSVCLWEFFIRLDIPRRDVVVPVAPAFPRSSAIASPLLLSIRAIAPLHALIEPTRDTRSTCGAWSVSTSVPERNVGAVAANETSRPRVVMMCGPGGAGKTTYAKRLESEGWTRLSFEVEFWYRGITTMPYARVVADVAAELKVRLLHHVAVGNDVVLDFGFWFRRQRDAYRALLAHQGIVPETVYIATSLETS